MSTSSPATSITEAPENGVAGGDGAAGDGVTGGPAAPARRPGPRERVVFIACATAIILYLVLAYFVFVRPGVDRTSHLLAVVVPAAVLALSAELWPRMPAGLRASLAPVFGVWALASGVAVAARVRAEGFIAGDLGGVLPLVAGVVLVALGVWILWTSRKRGGSLWWTVVRRALIAVAALLALYWLVLPVSLAIVATERPHEAIGRPDLGRPYESLTLTTRDGLKLGAWYVPSRNHAAIVTFPRSWTVAQARMLARNGYGVLLVDPRGYGTSQGDPNAYGWGSSADLGAAVAWLRRRPEIQKRRIGGLGLSMGGEQMLEAAAHNPGLKAVVSEGAGVRSVREAFVRRGESPLQLALRFPQDLSQTVAVWLLGADAVPPSLVRASAAISPRAVFFIYGADGQEVEKAVNPAYYAAAGQPKEIWEVPGAGHTGGITAQPVEYERRVVGFFDRYLLGRR